NCVDFPVESGATGTIQYPCAGGSVTAKLGSISFSGSVQAGMVSLEGKAQIVGPDNCLWETNHYIEGHISPGSLTYVYSEIIVAPRGSLAPCWQPCTESGTITIHWGRAD